MVPPSHRYRLPGESLACCNCCGSLVYHSWFYFLLWPWSQGPNLACDITKVFKALCSTWFCEVGHKVTGTGGDTTYFSVACPPWVYRCVPCIESPFSSDCHGTGPPLLQVSQGCGLQWLSVKVKFSLCRYGFVMMKSIRVKLPVGLVLTWVAKYTEFKCQWSQQ